MHDIVGTMNLNDADKQKIMMMFKLEQQQKEIEYQNRLMESEKIKSVSQAKTVEFAEGQIKHGETLLQHQQHETEQVQRQLKRAQEEVEEKKQEVNEYAKMIERTKGLLEPEKYPIGFTGYFYNAGAKGEKPSYTHAHVVKGEWVAGFKVEVKDMAGNTLYKGFEPKFKAIDAPAKSVKRNRMGAIVNDEDGVRFVP